MKYVPQYLYRIKGHHHKNGDSTYSIEFKANSSHFKRFNYLSLLAIFGSIIQAFIFQCSESYFIGFIIMVIALFFRQILFTYSGCSKTTYASFRLAKTAVSDLYMEDFELYRREKEYLDKISGEKVVRKEVISVEPEIKSNN